MISYSICDYVCLFLIFLLILYIIRNKVPVTFFVLLFILIGFFILRSYTLVVKNENFRASLDIYYPLKKDGVCSNNEEECSYPAINGRLDKKSSFEQFKINNASLDIYYPDNSCKGGNCLYPAVNKSITTDSKYINKEYENIYTGTWVNVDSRDTKYNFLQKNDTLLLSVDNKNVIVDSSSQEEETRFLYNVNKYKFILKPDRLSFYNTNDKSIISYGVLLEPYIEPYLLRLYINDTIVELTKQSRLNINTGGFTSAISNFYNNSANLNDAVQLEELEPNNNKYILNSSTFNNIFDTTDTCVFNGSGNNDKYYAIFLDPSDYSVLGINNDSTDLELTMHNYTELSNNLRNNFKPTMKLSELLELSKDTMTIDSSRRIYSALRYLINKGVSSDNFNEEIVNIKIDYNLNNKDINKITNIFSEINSKYENYDLDSSEFLKQTVTELNKDNTQEVNIFKVNNINKAQNSCDMTISFVPTIYDKSGLYRYPTKKHPYVLNTEYYVVPNNEGAVDLTFQKLYSKNRIFRFEYMHNVEKNREQSSLFSYLSDHMGTSGLHYIFDCYIRCNDGRYLNNSKHCISGTPHLWTVALFKNTNKDLLSKLLNYQ